MSISQKKCWDDEWPKESLESVRSCPVCGCENSELLLNSLVDNAFFVAPGKWNLYQCKDCRSAYLNPRPDQASIHEAYGTYYTHETSSTTESSAGNSGLIQRLRRQLANGYYNYHHGTKRKPFISLGAWLLFLYPKFRKSASAKFRYLKQPKAGQKLLDVGCGNGDYLSLASEVGWRVKGVEPDPKAYNVARTRGFEVVQGSLEEIVNSGELFDVITMSHVIEHVHDPVSFMKLAYKCLKPGGILYIDTPNIESSGARRFGKNWRGIEAPRHLVLFSQSGLENILSQSCFGEVIFKSRSVVRKAITLRSYRMEGGKSQFDETIDKLPLKIRVCLFLPRMTNREEFLTVLAVK